MPLPNFFLIGTCKAGTTSMYHYLRQHPEVFLSDTKEPNFFGRDATDSSLGGPGDKEARRRWVTELLAYRKLFEGAKSESVIGEGTCKYLYSEHAAAEIFRLAPKAKLIVILRNPAHRAYSAYLHLVRTGRETLSFSQALSAEAKRIKAGWNSIWHYRNAGYYYPQLQRFLTHFGSQQIKVHLYEDWLTHNRSILEDTFRFLEIDNSFEPDITIRYQASGIPRNRMLYTIAKKIHDILSAQRLYKPNSLGADVGTMLLRQPSPLPLAIHKNLTDQYHDDVVALQTLIGRDLSTWLSVTAYK